MKVKIPTASWAQEWHMKEYGSWEDSGFDPCHPAAIMAQQGKVIDLSDEEIDRLLTSGRYQSTAWQPDEIMGGTRTMLAIGNFVKKLKQMYKNQKT